jgi:hypothetical protein
MADFVIWNSATDEIRGYPRSDAEPVVGLEQPPLFALQVVREPEPEYDSATQQLLPTRTVNPEALTWTWGWDVQDLPPPPPPPPDYRGFYEGLLASQVYGAVVTTPGKSGDQAAAMTVFLGAIQDCLGGRENRPALQQAIWLLLGQLQLGPEGLGELQSLMDTTGLADVYSLVPS